MRPRASKKTKPVDNTPAHSGPFRVLIVDDEPDIREALSDALSGSHVQVQEAATAAQARQALANASVDLVLLDVKLPDGDGLELAQQMHLSHPDIPAIVMTGQPSLQRAVEAIRVGATDFLAKPLDLRELNERVHQALGKRRGEDRKGERIVRLRRICKKLNHARHQVNQQVDILCNDLVTAYQELVGRMHQMELGVEFKALLAQELDLEQSLRRILEYLLKRAGSTNAVVFLPGRDGAYAVGGYVNYTCPRESLPVLLDHLASVAGPKIADLAQPLHLTDNARLSAWLGDDSAWLLDMHVIACPCRQNQEVLASMMVFRDNSEPFDPSVTELLAALAPILAAHLSKVVHVHNRHSQLFGDPSEPDPDDDAWGVA